MHGLAMAQTVDSSQGAPREAGSSRPWIPPSRLSECADREAVYISQKFGNPVAPSHTVNVGGSGAFSRKCGIAPRLGNGLWRRLNGPFVGCLRRSGNQS